MAKSKARAKQPYKGRGAKAFELSVGEEESRRLEEAGRVVYDKIREEERSLDGPAVHKVIDAFLADSQGLEVDQLKQFIFTDYRIRDAAYVIANALKWKVLLDTEITQRFAGKSFDNLVFPLFTQQQLMRRPMMVMHLGSTFCVASRTVLEYIKLFDEMPMFLRK